MADHLGRVAAFILGPSARADDDEFEAEFGSSSDDEPTDVVEMETTKSAIRERPRSARQQTSPVTPVDPRRRPARQVALSEVRHVRPYAFSEAAGIGESFKDGVVVVLNLTTTDEKQAQKLIDFCAGAAFVTDGKLERITSRVFLLLPSTVRLSQEDKNLLAENHQLSE